MHRDIDIRYRPSSRFDSLLGLAGSRVLIASGALLLYFAIQFALHAKSGDPGGLRYVFGGFFGLGGVFLLVIGLLSLYWTITTPFDRSVKLTAARIVRWEQVRGVQLPVLTLNLVRQSATITPTLRRGAGGAAAVV